MDLENQDVGVLLSLSCSVTSFVRLYTPPARLSLSFSFLIFFVLFRSFLLFLPDLVKKLSQTDSEKENKNHAAGKITICY